jgi:hypothetical protein
MAHALCASPEAVLDLLKKWQEQGKLVNDFAAKHGLTWEESIITRLIPRLHKNEYASEEARQIDLQLLQMHEAALSFVEEADRQRALWKTYGVDDVYEAELQKMELAAVPSDQHDLTDDQKAHNEEVQRLWQKEENKMNMSIEQHIKDEEKQ